MSYIDAANLVGSFINFSSEGRSDKFMGMQPSIHPKTQRPTNAFIGASWMALFVGGIAYLVGLWNAQMLLNEKGYYFTLLFFGLFSAVSLQKSVRDRLQGIPVTGIYFGLCWCALGLSLLLLAIGLWNATLALSEKGFYAMSFVLSLFSAVAVQKNIRDVEPTLVSLSEQGDDSMS